MDKLEVLLRDSDYSQLSDLTPGQRTPATTVEEDADQLCSGDHGPCETIFDDCRSSVSNHDDSNGFGDMKDADFRVVEEYTSLVQLYREYPKDMRVQMILRDNASCENDLDLLRCQYFEMLKDSCDDFPFGNSAELKRCMFTRSGEPVAVRLAQDLYSIISVTDGENHSILKGMISSGRKGKKTSVVSGCRGRLRSRTQSTAARNQEMCACSKELLLLKDTISTLQTNVLNTHCIKNKLCV